MVPGRAKGDFRADHQTASTRGSGRRPLGRRTAARGAIGRRWQRV
ncbi:hypothetical protein KCH_29100 [Kitasatospora cheerisanensis KCTC 2395]|uniref:Uncharacterized protein n=1 Tax=Kitasatospora cheerisanensis KCTC 2395 TaxID=1348663 RepID=A0A066YZB4_9ACTN|nr:hypothetical protein KCH_29100 [Kitasatospora cheerisanensis KCTC 2395]